MIPERSNNLSICDKNVGVHSIEESDSGDDIHSCIYDPNYNLGKMGLEFLHFLPVDHGVLPMYSYNTENIRIDRKTRTHLQVKTEEKRLTAIAGSRCLKERFERVQVLVVSNLIYCRDLTIENRLAVYIYFDNYLYLSMSR